MGADVLGEDRGLERPDAGPARLAHQVAQHLPADALALPFIGHLDRDLGPIAAARRTDVAPDGNRLAAPGQPRDGTDMVGAVDVGEEAELRHAQIRLEHTEAKEPAARRQGGKHFEDPIALARAKRLDDDLHRRPPRHGSLTELDRITFSSVTEPSAMVATMPLPNDYAAQNCSVARALEVLGERWTLLIIRDAFYGVRRFNDFVIQLDIPRAVLTARLKALVDEGVLARVAGAGGRDEYELSEKGVKLWPIVRSLMQWGDEYYAPAGRLRVLRHAEDGGVLDAEGRCERCGEEIPVAETRIEPGPGYARSRRRGDPVSKAMAEERRLLEPLRP
jgi:DNA-binding HxlR family transcriptional regulator